MQKQGSIISGSILILVGLFFLAAQFFPNLATLINFDVLWPFLVIGVGAIFLLGGLVNTPPLFIPGSIISGVGLILLYQNLTGNWHHWQLWLLVNVFIGVGILLTSLREGKGLSGGMPAAGILIGIGLVLFFAFTFADLWPVALILIGLFFLVRNLGGRRKQRL
ncbi:MAG: hypothetical protein KDE51_10650 [Anaerolineales bacterium]|nr:hypothetical protein [Anaerolineales bacterium]